MAEKAKTTDLGEVRLENVRLSFAHLFEPQDGKVDEETGKKGEDKYNCAFLMSKTDDTGTKNLQRIKKAADAVKKNKWGDNIPKLKPEKVCLRDGELEDWDGYDGHFYLTASNTRPPVLVDRDRAPLKKSDGKLYSGCFVNAIVRLWAQDNKHGKRLNASLEAVQFYKHGEAFGAKPVDPNAAFDDVSDTADDLAPIGGGDDDDGLI